MTNDISTTEPIAPVYRYYVEDLISGKKLAELDFRGVSYKLALNAAGDFSGSLVVKDVANATNLYNATLPGVTALYVLRNGVCVWGGIIWERDYVPEDKKLSVSASEFTSYLHHRKIWKTWNHQFGATVTPDSGMWRVNFDNGSSVLAKAGSTVKMEFYEVENFKYNGYYRVADSPAPSKDVFYMRDGASVADIVRQVRQNSTVVGIYTKENHGFNTGDVVSIRYTQIGDVVYENGSTVLSKTITAPGGPESNYFTYTDTAAPDSDLVASGTASRPLPAGTTFERVTVGVRQDTFDYVKSLIEGTFNDFVGTDFPNVYIEPGISTGLDIVSKRAFEGYNIVKTNGKHNIAVGQAVQIQDVGKGFDGEVEVLGIEEGDSIVYKGGGDLPVTPVTPKKADILIVTSDKGIVSCMTTGGAHGFLPGENVTIDMGVMYPELSGTFQILDVPANNKFRYVSGTNASYSAETIMIDPIATSNSVSRVIDSVSLTPNVAFVTTKQPHGFTAGNTVQIANVQTPVKVIEASLDGPNHIATVQTDGPHNFKVGETTSLLGLTDFYSITDVNSTTTRSTFTTSAPHNLRANDQITIMGVDTIKVVGKQMSSSVATLTLEVPHNFALGSTFTAQNLIDNYTITGTKIVDNVATLTTSIAHNVKVNDEVSTGSLPDYYRVITKAADDGNITLTTRVPHNLWEGAKIIVSGLGAPFDGEATVVSFTDQRIMYKADSKYITAAKDAAKKGSKPAVPITVPEQRVNANTSLVTVKEGYLVGDWKVTAVTSNTISFSRGGNNYAAPSGVPGVSGSLSTLSYLNGTYTISGRAQNSISFSKTGNTMPYVNIPVATKDDDIQAVVIRDSAYVGAKTVLSTTSRTFTVGQTLSYAATKKVDLQGYKRSILNGTFTLTSTPTADRFTFDVSGTYTNSMVEQAKGANAFASQQPYSGTNTISIVTDDYTFGYAKTWTKQPARKVQGAGKATVTPLAVVSTFGPYPGNADIEFVFPDNDYSGVNIEPSLYRGFELKTVGEALDEYASNINGFEYRIDCEYLPDEDRFIKKFRILPIDFPNPPGEGEVSPISRFGADKLVFEYPSGSISTFSMRESAEESATRFFALGENELGPDVGPYIGVASADDLLRGDRDGRKWPLLDASDSVDGIDDKAVLHAYAKRYLSELQPPFASFQITVNGSRSPFVGTYKPGDWCSIVVDDPWMQMRLSSDLEPRDDVLVRKIDSISVSVPDGVTYPENVTVDLVAEWEVDKRGK